MGHLCHLIDMEVLDTAALLSWPLDALTEGICALSQLDELKRLSPSRFMMIESQGPKFESPTQDFLNVAIQSSKNTGDYTGLSPVDIDVLALALEKDLPLVTDDYRLQNVCASIGHSWRGVIQEGVSEVRLHSNSCRYCGHVNQTSGNCSECGN